MKKQIKLTAALLAGAIITGCQSTSTQIGKGPVTLSPAVQATFEKYQKGNGLSFAITEDGSGSIYYFCKDSHCRAGSPFEAVRTCNHYYGEGRCKLYAIGKEIVWQFDSATDEAADKLAINGWHAMTISWDTLLEEHKASLFLKTNKEGHMTVMSSETARCKGPVSLTKTKQNIYHSGTWSLECENGQQAEGTITIQSESTGGVKSISATGKDEDKNRLVILNVK